MQIGVGNERLGSEGISPFDRSGQWVGKKQREIPKMDVVELERLAVRLDYCLSKTPESDRHYGLRKSLDALANTVCDEIEMRDEHRLVLGY